MISLPSSAARSIVPPSWALDDEMAVAPPVPDGRLGHSCRDVDEVRAKIDERPRSA